MTLVDLYLPARQVHITAVMLSVALFAVRGAAVLARQGWPMTRPVRLASVVIDTVLLTAGVTLWTMLGLNPARDLWLGAKLALLLVYISLGSLALKRAPTWRGKALAYVAALLCVGWMLSIALTRHPAGVLRHSVGG